MQIWLRLTTSRDHRELLNTRAARYRSYMVIMMAFFGQWSGNNVVSYFMVCLLVVFRFAERVLRSHSPK